MNEPRQSWWQILESLGIRPGTREEEEFIHKHFPKANVRTFRCDLSRGFTPSYAPALERLCHSTEHEYVEATWIRPRKEVRGQHPDIRYVGNRIARSQEFYDQLAIHYRLAHQYECIRVGGPFSRNRTSFSEFDSQGLALNPDPNNPRMPYLRTFWHRLRQGSLTGNSVHFVRTIDRLVELWACAEVLRSFGLHEENRVYMAPIVPPAPHDDPVMGVRIVDQRLVLLSMPGHKHGESQYSSWIESRRLAEFTAKYVERARLYSSDITSLQPAVIEDVMGSAFRNLRDVETHSRNYGSIDSIGKAKKVKSRMVELAREGIWYPVLA
jgi:hypothetical protein